MNYIENERRNFKIDNIDEYISIDNKVRVIDRIIDQFDLDALGFEIGNNKLAGRPRYNSKDLLKLYVYGLMNGVRSARKLEKLCEINLEVIWLLKGLKPKFRTIADFRASNIECFEPLFEELVKYCMASDLYGKKLVALDGTRLEANASKRKHYSLKKLAKMKNIMLETINDCNSKLKDSTTNESNKITILEKIEKCNDKIEYYEELEEIIQKSGASSINLTDSDAKIVKFGASNGTDVGYNIQSVVDSKNKLILTFGVSDSAEDSSSLVPMALKSKDMLNVESLELLADKGYFVLDNIKQCEAEKIITYIPKIKSGTALKNPKYYFDNFKFDANLNAFICPEGNILKCVSKLSNKNLSFRNSEACIKCPNKKDCTTNKLGRTITQKNGQPEFIEKLRKRLDENREKFSLRQCLVEHPFGTLKRVMNFYYLTLRTKRKVRGEVSLAFFSYNIKRLVNIIGKELIFKKPFPIFVIFPFHFDYILN